MKKKTVIWLTILLVFVASVAFFIYFQWNNITAVIDSFRYTQEEVTEKMEVNKQELQNYIDKDENVTVRDLTKEEAEALNSGELTEEEVIELLTEKSSEDQHKSEDKKTPTSDEKTSQTPEIKVPEKKEPTKSEPVKNEPPKKEPTKEEVAGKKVSEAIARLYIQKNAYLSKLDIIEAEAIERYKQYSREERKTAKSKIISEYFPRVASWEKECDGVVYGILNEIKSALKESGQSMDIADKIEQAYLDEKSLKKSYFIGRYMD